MNLRLILVPAAVLAAALAGYCIRVGTEATLQPLASPTRLPLDGQPTMLNPTLLGSDPDIENRALAAANEKMVSPAVHDARPKHPVRDSLQVGFRESAVEFRKRASVFNAQRVTFSAIAIVMISDGRNRPVVAPFRCPPADLAPTESFFMQNSDYFVFSNAEFPALRKLNEVLGLYSPQDPVTGEVPSPPPGTMVSEDLKADIEAVIQRAYLALDG